MAHDEENQGTLRGRYPLLRSLFVPNRACRHRLVSCSYGLVLPCHGRGLGLRSQVPTAGAPRASTDLQRQSMAIALMSEGPLHFRLEARNGTRRPRTSVWGGFQIHLIQIFVGLSGNFSAVAGFQARNHSSLYTRRCRTKLLVSPNS
jgi:hypothetical protein